MTDYQISKSEYESVCQAVHAILEQPVDQIVLAGDIPPLNEVSDSNSVFKSKLSVLFVDIRKSTDLTDEIETKEMVKVYRAFARAVIQAIRYAGGFVRQFAGDGIMGVFQDEKGEMESLSSQKAVNAARYVLTLIDYCLNPQFKEKLSGVCIGCGIGICTGEILITKAGMRGKEADDSAENEVGIIWAGSTTNYASRFCGQANAREIFIDGTTFNELSPEKAPWVEVSRIKNNHIFSGYISEGYYLNLPDGVTQKPSVSEEEQNLHNVNSDTRAIHLLDAIAEKASKIAVAESAIQQKEAAVKKREAKATSEEQRLVARDCSLQLLSEGLQKKDKENKEYDYSSHEILFSITHCKTALIKELGKDFWENLIQKMFVLGTAIGKTETDVKSDLDCYLVGIYRAFEMYEEAYDALCIQAEYGSWLNTSIVEEVVRGSTHWSRLKGILEKRVEEDFSKALNKLRGMGY